MAWLSFDRVSASTPLCVLSDEFNQEVFASDARIGAVVLDLESDSVWLGGDRGTFPIHSLIKPPLAWAVMSRAEYEQRALTEREQRDLLQMVAYSENEDVGRYLRAVGGGLSGYYELWGVPELTPNTDPMDWGRSRVSALDIARLYAALATSDEVSADVRQQGFDLLRQVVPEQRWGALVSALSDDRLSDWESLVKMGAFLLPDPDDPETFNQPARTRMHSVAIWLTPPEQGSQPRYVAAVLIETPQIWNDSVLLQNRIGALIANAIADRVLGETRQISPACLRQALS